MMGTDVPDKAKAFKAGLKPFFEGFASPDVAASSSIGSCRVQRASDSKCEEGPWSMLPPSGGAAAAPDAGRSASRLPHIRTSPLPQSIEEVGRLVERSNALGMPCGMDTAEHGGFAHRCPAGWNSGYREEPMSKEEIRRARIVEKCLAPRRHRGSAAPHTAR